MRRVEGAQPRVLHVAGDDLHRPVQEHEIQVGYHRPGVCQGVGTRSPSGRSRVPGRAARRDEPRRTGRRHHGRVRTARAVLLADLAVKALTVGLLALALAMPERAGFAGKAMPARAVAYPIALLVVPVAWALVRRAREVAFPVLADLLFSLPWAIDMVGNALDLFAGVSWFDELTHPLNWALLAGALGLVLPRALPVWVRVLLGSGCGALAALVWELFEYLAYIRGTAAEATVYVDTLGDMTLGTAGATLASAVVAVAAGRRVSADGPDGGAGVRDGRAASGADPR